MKRKQRTAYIRFLKSDIRLKKYKVNISNLVIYGGKESLPHENRDRHGNSGGVNERI
jgi:hypothetical protein